MKLPSLALPCPACGKTFTRQAGLSKHLRTCPALPPREQRTSAEPLTVTLDRLPVGVNQAYMHTTLRTKSGRLYTARRLTETAQAWRRHATLRIQEAAAQAAWGVVEGTPLQLRVQFSLPKLYQSDVDGLLKLPLDALKDAIGTDDRYILDLTVGKRRGPEGVVLTVQILPSEQALATWSEL